MWIKILNKIRIVIIKELYLQKSMIHTLNLEVKGIVYENGNTEILIVTPRQWSAKMRNKKYKNNIVNTSKLASINLKIKTK